MEAFDKNNKNLDENFCLLPTEALMQSCSSIKLKSIRAVKKKLPMIGIVLDFKINLNIVLLYTMIV